jgi:hypothetical protein
MGNMNELTFKVVECNETKNADFHVKLQYKGEIEASDDFGTTTQTTQVTFYRFVDQAIKVGAKGKIDFGKFDIQEREYDTGDEIVMLKYLKPKKA